jgi:hypothetical protein
MKKSAWMAGLSGIVALCLVPWAEAWHDEPEDSHKSALLTASVPSEGFKVVGRNDLGMHCVDGTDYSVFSILPPYNNLRVHLIDKEGKLVRDPSKVRVTYLSVKDPSGSINTSSIGKTNFWQYAQALFGVVLKPDVGLAGQAMPGGSNTPQPMKFDPATNEFYAEGIPITPYPDIGGAKNYYPLMRVVVRSNGGTMLASSDIVLPVSDEMDCKLCHASGVASGAMPPGGWVWDASAQRDFKRNILKLHDASRDPVRWPNLLAAVGYKREGLLATSDSGTPVLCARCHKSNALPGTGYGTLRQLTTVIHAAHANVLDPITNTPMDAIGNRASCYRCHPGSETKCLRGAMGNALASDGTVLMQCQSCHGNMAAVGAFARQGWLDEPSCENCHTGNALRNSGQIRYTSVFSSEGLFREPADRQFAEEPAKLYRLSKGHGGLNCETCHGPTHAEYPSSHANDNLQIVKLQGHDGTLAECTACHKQMPETVTGGPHGLHPVGQYWVNKHEGAAERGVTSCQVCHGPDYRGTVLSAALAPRTFKTEWGTRIFAKGAPIGCYNCHNGPRGK